MTSLCSPTTWLKKDLKRQGMGGMSRGGGCWWAAAERSSARAGRSGTEAPEVRGDDCSWRNFCVMEKNFDKLLLVESCGEHVRRLES
jgi:hypothetical protein